jgi:hypothetical protein
LPEGFFKVLALSDVARDTDQADDVAGRVSADGLDGLQQDGGAVTEELIFKGEGGICGKDRPILVDDTFGLVDGK